MKQIIYILLTTTVLGLMSCSDWLDVSPKTSIPTDKQFESESGFKDALTGIYLKLGTQTLYAGDLTYAYLDELAGLYSDYPGYNTNAVFNQSIVFDYENMFLSKKNGIYSATCSARSSTFSPSVGARVALKSVMPYLARMLYHWRSFLISLS